MKPEKTKFLGVGVEWADGIQDDFIKNLHSQTVFELIPENFTHGQGKKFLDILGESQVPCLVHGVELSIGTAEPFKQSHFDEWNEVLSKLNVANVSDHLCMTEAGGIEIGQLTPLPWNQENADIVCRKISQIQDQLNVPFLIENITNRFEFPETQMRETEFINYILEKTGCYLLLDMNNITTNSFNFKYDPIEWLEQINLDKVDTIHLAGGEYDNDGDLQDSHNHAVRPETWALYRWVCERVQPSATIIERTGKYPGWDAMMKECEVARSILRESEMNRFISAAETTLLESQGSAL